MIRERGHGRGQTSFSLLPDELADRVACPVLAILVVWAEARIVFRNLFFHGINLGRCYTETRLFRHGPEVSYDFRGGGKRGEYQEKEKNVIFHKNFLTVLR